ncbi:hypothetical protein [Amycolatopsis magusensis]|uniref:Exonuclease VII small subunit n=1 Tax=Amycolatopsis magusensis TaxID=882444 RepID=A0ABS4PWK0_9PSEU|nr:hypothetical protein [Amycolatopsis magusensis]MBP2183807.1 exonuclease VII small subunit [Amycolatopsis magusensis]
MRKPAERPRKVVEKVVREPVIVRAAARPSISAKAISGGPSATSYAMATNGTKTVIAESGKPVVVQHKKGGGTGAEKKAEPADQKLDKAVAKLGKAEKSVADAEKSLSNARTRLSEAKGEVESIRKEIKEKKEKSERKVVKIKLPGKIDVSPEAAKKLHGLAQQK